MVDQDLDTQMTALALQAGAKIIEIYDANALNTQSKADASPVTAADLAADEVIRTGLAKAFPDIPIVTEEAMDRVCDGVEYEVRLCDCAGG